jgi:hypothetical protein
MSNGSGKFVTCEVDLEAMKAFENGCAEYPRIVQEEFGQAVRDLIFAVEAKAKELCPKKTGKLRASIHGVVESWAQGFVGTNTEYAAAVEFGTAPHEITPVSGKALAFEGSVGKASKFVLKGRGKNRHAEKQEIDVQGTIFRKKVMHPGTAPQPFFEPAFIYGEKIAPKLFEQAMQRALARLERLLK